MSESSKTKIAVINRRLSVLLAESRAALQGQREFEVETVRALSSTIREMDPVMSNAKILRRSQPEISGEIDLYISQLTELKTALEQIGIMLHSRKASLDDNRAHMEVVSRWATAFQSTR